MCARTDSANEVRDAAKCLAAACISRSIRDIYNEVLDEPLPDDWLDILNGKQEKQGDA